ncbi:PEP-CTERM sorting domain-containing protein [Rubritalea halochordaticola]
MNKNCKTALWPCAMLSVSLLVSAQAAIVFSDDFDNPNGTLLNGKAPDVGDAVWSVTAGAATLDVNAGTLDTSGGGRAAFGAFASALGSGEKLTLTYTTVDPAGTFMGGTGYSGVSLFTGASEDFFTGERYNVGEWGVQGVAAGGQFTSGDSTVATTATFTYIYDTGEWSFVTSAGVDMSGTGTVGKAINRLRIANGNGADIALDGLSVDISAIPEPSSSVMLGLCGIGLVLKRRR